MAVFTHRIRAKKPAWDDFNVADAVSITMTEIVSSGGNALKVFPYDSDFSTFNPTMAFIKQLTDGSVSIDDMAVYSYNAAPAKYAINFTSYPDYEDTSLLFICFDYNSVSHALNFYPVSCGP